MQYCYIEFDIIDDQNFNDLQRVFELVKYAKNNDRPQNEEFWLSHFPPYAVRQFYFSPDDIRPPFQTAEFSEIVWPFYGLIDLLQANYDIEYIDCEKTTDTGGRLTYNPNGYPYGGTAGLITFVLAFNCRPTVVYDGISVYNICFSLDNDDFELKDVKE